MKASPSQILKQAETLKTALSGDGLSSAESWQKRQELCSVLEHLLLIDLDYALDKKVEQDLWSFVFRNPISACQSKAKEHKKSNHGSTTNSQLVTLFKTASGFYYQLLQKICCAYDLELPAHPRDGVYGLTEEWVNRYPVAHQPRKSSLMYICQHCLVHLGDLARYRGNSLQAENFYRHAVDLVPSNGQPYNQLALLEAASGEKLSTVFFYIRSLTVQHPFPFAATNLQTLFSKISFDNINHEGKTRMTAFEYVSMFLQFQAAVHLNTDLKAAEKTVPQLSLSLPALIIAEKFETWQLLQMVAVSLFAVEHAHGSVDSEKGGDGGSNLLSPDELKTASLIEELIANMLYAFLLPIHASREPRDSAFYYTMPAIKIILDWLLQDATLLQHEALSKKPQVWHGLCKLLNDLDAAPPDTFNADKFEDIPLPEDWDLQCFLPLRNLQRRLKFDITAKVPSEEDANWLRCVRLCKMAEFMTEEGNEGLNLLSITHVNGRRQFKAVHQADALPEQVLQQIQELTVASSPTAVSLQSPNGASPSNSSSLSDHAPPALRTKSCVHLEGVPQQEVRFKLDEAQQRKEKLEGERESVGDKADRRTKDIASNGVRERRVGRQNVAMQAILQQRAAQNSSGLLGRAVEIGKDPATLQQELVVRQQTRPTNHVDSSHHLRSSQESPRLTPQLVQEVNLNRATIRHLSPEQYTQRQQQSLAMNGSQQCDRNEQWIPPYNMHPNNISTVGPVVRNNTVANYLQNSLPHVVQSSAADFPYHTGQSQSSAAQQQTQQQQQQIPSKQVAGPPQAFLANPNNMLWNYMGFVAPFQQANPSSHQLMIQPSTHHQQPTQQQQQQQQQTSYYMMNSGVQPKMPQLDSAVAQNVLHSFRNTTENSLPPSSDIFRDQDQLSVHRVWQPDNGRAPDMAPGHLSINQVVGRNVGQALQASLSTQTVQNNGSSVSSSHDMGSNTYSLFNSPWPSGLSMHRTPKEGQHHGSVDQVLMQSRIQSLWSGPGPSPLERLLEQQKQRRDSAAQ